MFQPFPALLRNSGILYYNINSYECNPIAYNKTTLLRCKPGKLRINVQKLACKIMKNNEIYNNDDAYMRI